MSNMSYCRFENTYHDLEDCFDHLEENTNPEEEKAKRLLIELCKRIAKASK